LIRLTNFLPARLRGFVEQCGRGRPKSLTAAMATDLLGFIGDLFS
jgi:hypothetical protein